MTRQCGATASAWFGRRANRTVVTLRERWRVTTCTVTLGSAIKDLGSYWLAALYAFSLTAEPLGHLRRRLHSLP